MNYSVSESRQTSGGGDYIVKYDADVELLSHGRDITVEVLSTVPPNAEPRRIEEIRECIQRGVELAMGANGQGCVMRLSKLAVHPVDFKPTKFEEITARELRRAIAEISNRE